MIDHDVTNAELEVLQRLWQHGSMTVRQLADLLYPGGKPAQYATVQTLLCRLEGKGCVRGDRGVRPHHFQATVDREALIGWHLQRTADRLCGGSLRPLLLQLIEQESVPATARHQLRTLAETLWNKAELE